MADEIKKVVTIDAGNSITTLKEYKQHIDDLRGALLALDETSEEYKDISQEITEEQARLNEVMKVGKNNADAADGSYNQLVQTMAELKKQWRATADEAERADLGQQILDINNQLKDLDASTGNFQRNVGDYQHAFEDAFKTISSQMQAMGGEMGKLTGTVTKLIPLIKSASAAATTGLKGIKKGIASTGIGLLIVALGTIVAYWEDIYAWAKKTFELTDTLAEKTEKLANSYRKIAEQQEKYYTELLENEEFAHELRVAQGEDEMESLQTLYTVLELKKKELETDENVVKLAQLKLQLGTAEAELAHSETFQAKRYWKEQKESLTSQIDALKEKGSIIETNAALLAEYTKKMDSIEKSMMLESAKRATDAAKEAEEAAKAAAEAARKAYQDRKKAADELAESIRQASLTEIQKLDETYKKQMDQLKAFGDTYAPQMLLLTKQYEEQRAKIIKEQEDAITAAIVEAAENDKEAMMSVYEAEAEQANFLAENRIAGPNETELQQEQALADAKYDIEKHLIEQKIALQQSYIDELKANNQDVCAEEEALSALRQDMANLDIARAKEVADFKKKAEKEAAELTKTVWQSASKSVADIFGSLSDMMEEGSAEQKAFAVMETTINTISGAIAAYKSMASIPYVGPALGAAAAAAVGVAGAASIKKIMETKKGSSGSGTVDVPTPEAPNMSAVVSPLLNEEQDIQGMTSLNEQGDSQGRGSQRVYVVESDIQEVGNRVKVRENESTF